MRIIVISGGLSHERDISIKSGARVAYVLRTGGHDVDLVDLGPRALDGIADGSADVVVNMLHGGAGEDGSVQSVLELSGVPFVGSGSVAARLAFDKGVAAGLLAAVGLRVPEAFMASHELFRELGATRLLDTFTDVLGLPLVVKPRQGGSALGVSLAHSAEELASALIAAFGYNDVALVQPFVPGIELSIAVVDRGAGPECLAPVQVNVPDGRLFDYNLRYTAGLVELVPDPEIEGVDMDQCKADALAVYTTLGMRDLARVDMIVDPNGLPNILEAAVVPGMAETSLFPVEVTATGIDHSALWDDLVAQAVGRTRS